MRTKTSSFLKKPPLTKAGDTSTIWPDASATNVVWVLGATEPWDSTLKFTGLRFASTTSTNRAGGATDAVAISGRALNSAHAAPEATNMISVGNIFFIFIYNPNHSITTYCLARRCSALSFISVLCLRRVTSFRCVNPGRRFVPTSKVVPPPIIQCYFR